MDQVAGSARAASDRHWRTERRDRQTASQEIKHEPEEERPFLKPVGQSTQQDDPDDDNDADGQCLDVSPLLARKIEPCAGRSERGQAELHPAKATPPRIRAQLVREGARWHWDSGEQGMLLAVLSVLAKAIPSPEAAGRA